MRSTRCHPPAPSAPKDLRSVPYHKLSCTIRGAVSGCPRAATRYRAHPGAVIP